MSNPLNEAFFVNLGFLQDQDILILAKTSTEMRDRVDTARCSSSPIQLSPDIGIYGLWNHFQLWEVAMYLRQCKLVRSVPTEGIIVHTLLAFITALDIAKRPFKFVPQHTIFVASFKFQPCDLTFDGEFETQSSVVQIPGMNESICLMATKERCLRAEEYRTNLFLWRTGMIGFPYAVSAVSVEFGVKLITDFSAPANASPQSRGTIEVHQRLNQRNTRLRRDIECGMDMIFVVSVYDMNEW